MIIQVLGTSIFVAIGLVASSTDIKYGKIKNSLILVGFVLGIIIYGGYAFYSFLIYDQINNLYHFGKIILNTFIAFLIGYFLWLLNFWAPGDAKFFALSAFLIPLEFYSNCYFPYFPSVGLLITFFVPFFFFFLIKGAIWTLSYFFQRKSKTLKIKNIFESLQKWLKENQTNALRYFCIIFIAIIFQFLIRNFQPFLKNFPYQRLISLACLFILIYSFNFFSQKKKTVFLILLFGIGITIYLILRGGTNIVWNFFKRAIFFMILFFFLRFLLNFYFEEKEIKKIKLTDLKEGAILSNGDLKRINNKLKFQNIIISSSPLSREEVKLIKRLFEKNTEEEIYISQTFPLIPFFLLSSLITILTKNSFSCIIIKILETLAKI